MTSIDSTAGLNGVEPLNLKISTENNCAPASSDHSASSPTSSTKSCGENIVPSGTGVSGASQDQGAPNSASPAIINLAIGNTTASPNLSPKQPLSSNNSGQSVSASTGTNVFIAPLTNKNNLLNNEANVKSNVPGQNIMNSNLIKPNVNNGSPTKLPIARIKKPAPLKPAPAQPVAHIAPNSTMHHPKPILPAPHNPSPVKTVHIAAKPPSASATNNNNKAIPAPTALINFLPSQSKTSPKSAQNGKQPDDAKSMQSLPSINTLTNGATFNLNQNQFYQFVPVSSQHLAALAAANGGNGAGNPLIIATTSMPKSYLAAPNRTDASGTESSPAAGQIVMKTIPPNIDPLLQQQYLNLMQQKPPQLKLSPKGAVKPTSPNQTNANSTANKPPLTVLPKPTQPQATPSSQPSSTPNDDYLALQQRLLAEERRNNLLENKLREQELLQQKHMHQIQPNPTINSTPTSNGACAIKPKPIAVKPAPSDDSKIVTTPNVAKTDSNNESGIHDESLISAKSTPTNASKSATNPSGKKRGRPRLYDVDPQTGKSIKPKQTTPVVTMQHQIQPQPSPQLLKMVINPSSNMLIMSAPRTQNPVSSAPPAMFPSPSTSNTSSDVPNERVLPKRDNEIQIDKQPPGQEKSPTIASNSHSEKENNNDQCKRAESGSPSKRKKTSPVKVVDESLSNKAPKTPPAQKAATGIPKQITPANLSPSAPLTHLLDGYIVKEAGKPFPLAKSQSNSSNKKHKSDEHVKCDQCGAKFNKKSGIGGAEDQSVLFCSESCAKRYKKKSKHRSDSTEMSKRFKHDQEINGDVTKTPPRQKLNSSMTTDSPSSKRSPHCKHYGSSSKHKHHSSSHKKDHHRGGHHSSHNHNNSISNGNNNDDTAMEGSFVQPAPVLASSTLSQTPIRTSSPNTSLMDTSATYPSGDPTNWSCDQVYQFVLQVTNNEQVARLFKTEEVDGSALSLIRDDHLVQTMQVKLGPALKIMSKFTELKAKYGH